MRQGQQPLRAQEPVNNLVRLHFAKREETLNEALSSHESMKANAGKDPWRTMELAKDCKWSNIWPANAFIGNYMRLEILSRAGLGDRVVEDIRGYFLEMADSTGTLWESITPTASCCHGFASYVTVLLARHARR